MIKKLIKLVDVKSIITLLFGGVFAYLAVVGKISEDSFMTVFVMIMTYYFAKGRVNSEESGSTYCPYVSQINENEENGTNGEEV